LFLSCARLSDDAGAEDQDIERRSPARDCGQPDAFGRLRGQVLQAVHRDVDLVVQERLLDLLGENADRAQLIDALAGEPVAGGADLDELDPPTGGARRELVANPLGLPSGETTCPRSDA
jgi:hypothetical protein